MKEIPHALGTQTAQEKNEQAQAQKETPQAPPQEKALVVRSFAKLNLALKIIRRRPDGYHDLATLFHRISLADTLTLRKRRRGFELRCSDPSLPVDETNLITKAYRALQQEIPGLGGVSVFLKKKIPVGAGLGGGSSNAASFLLGMKKLYRLKISQKKLRAMGAKLGADVPFFIHNLNQAVGIGLGDRIKNKATRTKHTFLLAVSKESLSTKAVYENLKGRFRPVSLTKLTRAITILCAFLEKKNYGPAERLLENDLEASAFDLRPSLQTILESFRKRGLRRVRMTGSGPTVFAILSPREARRVQKKLQHDLPSYKILWCHSC